MKIKISVLYTILLSFLFLSCFSNPPVLQIKLGKPIKKLADYSIRKHVITGSKLGYILYDPLIKKVIASKNSNALFIPASLAKVPSMLAAVNILGPEYRFASKLQYTGVIDKQNLKGNLILKGGGDPELRLEHLMDMVQNLKDRGINKITKNFYFDDSALAKDSRIDYDMEAPGAYNTGYSALIVNGNTLWARWKTKTERIKNKKELKKIKKKLKEDFKRSRAYREYKRYKKTYIDITEAYFIPNLSILDINVELAKDKEKKRYKKAKFIYNDDDENGGMDSWTLKQHKFARKGIKSLPIKHPSLYTALLFRMLCEKSGITVPYPQSINSKDVKKELNTNLLYTHYSRPLWQIAESLMLYSNNLTAELLTLSAAKKLSGKKQSIKKSAALISKYLKSIIKGIDFKKFYLANGSGLSTKTRVSPKQMLSFIIYADKVYNKKNRFMTMLPISGWRGSLFNRIKDPSMAFRIWAKTGTVFYGISLGGFLYTESGRKLMFILLVSDIDARKRIDKISLESKARWKAGQSAYWWLSKNRGVMEDMLLYWAKKL